MAPRATLSHLLTPSFGLLLFCLFVSWFCVVLVWVLEGLGWGGARRVPAHLALPFVDFVFFVLFWLFIFVFFVCCKEKKGHLSAVIQGLGLLVFFPPFFFVARSSSSSSCYFVFFFFLFVFFSFFLSLFHLLCRLFFFFFIPFSFSIFLSSCASCFLLPPTSFIQDPFLKPPPFFELNCFLLSYIFSYFLCFLFCCFWKTLVFVQVKGYNKTVFFNNPLFSKVSKVSVFVFACFAFFMYVSESSIKMVVSEKFETAHFEEQGHFWKSGSGPTWKSDSRQIGVKKRPTWSRT